MKKIISIILFNICLVGFALYVYSLVLTGGNLKIPIISSFSGGQKSIASNLSLNASIIGQAIMGGQMEGGNYRLLGGAAPAAATFATAKEDLSNAHCYPNPFKPSSGHTKITFTSLTREIEIKIYTISGELVKTLRKSDEKDYIEWDAKNSNGENLASGVYLYLINNSSQTKKGKLMIIW